MTSIRLANPTDAAVLAGLRYAFRSVVSNDIESETEFTARCEEWMRAHLQDPNWRCWIAEENQLIVGALWLQLIEKIPNPTNESELHGYITNVFVDQSQRGRGIGSSLLAEAVNFCKERPVHAVILWPTEKSRSLYERFGFNIPEDLLELLVSPTH